LSALAAAAARQRTPAKQCIALWTLGGLSQLETFDLKPPYSFFQGISTSVPGLRIGDRLPKLSRLMHHGAIIRSMTTPEAEHVRALYHTHTGTRPLAGGTVFPSIGSLVSKELGRSDFPLPNYVVIGTGSRTGVGAGAGYLGARYEPLLIRDPLRGVANLAPQEGMQRFDSRMTLLEEVEQGFYQRHRPEVAEAHLTTVQRAARMMHAREAAAYDISREPVRVRDAYGNHAYGRGCLLARRLIETGVPFVEIGMPDWDNHSGCRLHEENLLPLDTALSALITDLNARGLLDSTLIVLMGEFGRGGTGKVDRGIGENRGHWPRAWTTALFGGGVKGGSIIGRTDSIAAVVEERPVNIADFFATICSILGIDYMKENNSPGTACADCGRGTTRAAERHPRDSVTVRGARLRTGASGRFPAALVDNRYKLHKIAPEQSCGTTSPSIPRRRMAAQPAVAQRMRAELRSS
jgi:hypothetical protein